MKTLLNISFIIISMCLAACSSASYPRKADLTDLAPAAVASGADAQSRAIPKAVIYRTNGDYSDKVPVNLNDSRTALVSYPDPSDITASSTPVGIGDGWLFDRRGGVGANTAFLSFSFSEYAALKSAPSSAKMMRSIIPGAAVTQWVVTPVPFFEALDDPDILKQYIPR